MPVLAIVLPVFLVVALGVVLTRSRFLSAALIGELNRVTYFVGLPAYLFSSISGATLGGGRALTVFGVMGGATLLVLGTAFVVAKLRRVPAESVGSFLHAAIRGNLAYVGLPVISLALAARGGSAVWPVALLAMAPLTVIANVLGVLLLLVGHGKPGPGALRTLLWQLASNPLLIASLAGVLCAAAGVRLPMWLAQSIAVTGQMALPLALLCIGGTLVTIPLRGKRTHALIASLLKVGVAPLVGWPLARWIGLSAEETLIALLFLATPTAAASFTLAGKLGGDEALAASSVVISTALSILSLSAVLALV
ncbi:MAG TPA: AEC family transporter [Opitutaceae bacterium]|nr:AEC family transporter [Opitutaceae bacterium]